MIFEEDAFYSFKPESERKNTSYLHKFYSEVTKPQAILVTLAWVMGWGSTQIYPLISEKIQRNDRFSTLFIILVIITVIIGIRIIQSLYLANKDYSRIKFGIFDLIVFGAVMMYISGIVVFMLADHILWILIIYAGLCALAALNFAQLASSRVPSDARHLDIPIEQRIQIINTIIFIIFFVAFAVTAVLVLIDEQIDALWLCAPLLPVIPLVILNMIHSHQLSAWPKLTVDNKHLKPGRIEERLAAIVGADEVVFKRKRNVASAFREYSKVYKRVTLRRAGSSDRGLIADLYLQDFGYVVDHMTAGTGLDSRDLVSRLLVNSFGLGAFGYLRFYIIEVEGEIAGMVMPEFRTEPGLYRQAGHIPLAWFLLRRIGFSGTRQVYGKARRLRLLEPVPRLNELRINYLAVTAPNQGTGFRVISLLKQAFLNSSVNGFEAHEITAFVRERNAASVRLFEKAGFRSCTTQSVETEDSLSAGQGRLLRFTLNAT